MRSSGKSSAPNPFASAPAPVAEPEPPLTGARMRAWPRQQRARAAVDRILRATGELLDDAGFDALTTTAVAERADVNIATLYRYFPDKFALIEALALAVEQDRLARIDPVLESFGASSEWRRDLRRLLDTLLDFRLKRSGMKGLRRGLQSAPQLWTTQSAGFGRMVERFAAALRARVPSMSAARATLVATTTVSMVVGLLDWAMAQPAQRRAVVKEGGVALERYLAPYLD